MLTTGNVFAIPTTPNAGGGALLVEQVNTDWHANAIAGTVTFGQPSPTPVSILPPFVASERVMRFA
jgi:hypothetical protein